MVATPQQPVPLKTGGATPKDDWMDYLLKKLGVPDTRSNKAVLYFWTLSEDSTGGLNGGTNPLAICGASCPGVKSCLAQCGPGNCPVMSYETLQQGLDCTAWFILGQAPSARRQPLQGIINALNQSADSPDGLPDPKRMAVVFKAINISGWCSRCQGGKYPIALYNAINSSGKHIWDGVQTGLGPGTPDLPDISGPVKAGVKAVGKVVTAPLTAIEVM